MGKATAASAPPKLVGDQVRKSALKRNDQVTKGALKKAEAMGATAKFKGLTREQQDAIAKAVTAKASAGKGGGASKVVDAKVAGKKVASEVGAKRVTTEAEKVTKKVAAEVEAKKVKKQVATEPEITKKVSTETKKVTKVAKEGESKKVNETKIESSKSKSSPKTGASKAMQNVANQKEEKKRRLEAPSTPPTRRVSFKSPVSVVSTISDATDYRDKQAKAVEAFKAKIDLNNAALQSQLQAEMDAGGLSEFLDSMAENGHAGDLSAALLAASIKKKTEQEKQAEAEESVLPVEDGIAEEGGQEAEEEEDVEQDPEVDVEEATEIADNDEPEEDAEVEEEEKELVEGGEDEEEDAGEEDAGEDGTGEDPEELPSTSGAKLVKAVEVSKEIATKVQTRNSVTHKKEWDAFCRSSKTKAFPQELSGMFNRSKNSLFNAWLDSEQDWEKTMVTVEQSRSKETLSRNEMTAVKYKVLEAELGPKFKALYQLRLTQGLWYPDADFPTDEEERWIYMPKGKTLRTDERVAEKHTIKAQMSDTSGKMLQAMTSEEGPFAPGQLPGVKAASEAGAKNLLQMLTDDKNEIAKTRRQPRGGRAPEEPEEVVPKTPLESGSQSLI